MAADVQDVDVSASSFGGLREPAPSTDHPECPTSTLQSARGASFSLSSSQKRKPKSKNISNGPDDGEANRVTKKLRAELCVGTRIYRMSSVIQFAEPVLMADIQMKDTNESSTAMPITTVKLRGEGHEIRTAKKRCTQLQSTRG